jgi:hypothetical protein
LTEDEVWAKGMEELRSGIQCDPDGPIFHDSTNASAAALWRHHKPTRCLLE